MAKTDTRTLSPSAQYELLKQVVRLKESGRSGFEVAEITGLTPEHVSRIWRSYCKGGLSAIRVKTRGRRPGYGARLETRAGESFAKFDDRQDP